VPRTDLAYIVVDSTAGLLVFAKRLIDFALLIEKTAEAE